MATTAPASGTAASAVPVSGAPVSAVFGAVLASHRSLFNARVAEMRHRHSTLDTQAFAAFLRSAVDGVVQRVAALAPQRTEAVAIAAYDVALELVAQGLAGPGARSEWVELAWLTVLADCAACVAEQPQEVLGAISNAVLHLGAVPGARPQQWLDEMARLGPQVASTAQLLALGQLLAWRAGLAHFRGGALRAAEALPPPLALQAVGAGAHEDWLAVRDAMRTDCWWMPATPTALPLVRVGQFTGFGGTLEQPPQVRTGAGGFVVRSKDRYSVLVADACGAVLLPCSADEFEQEGARGDTAPVKLAGSRLRVDGREVELDLPPEGLALAVAAHAVAVTSPFSHAIRLVPRQPRQP